MTQLVLGVVCDLLRAQVTTDKDSVVLTSASACVRVYLLISHLQRIVTHTVLGVVCDLLRAQVTTDKDSVVLKSASVRT